MGTQEPSVRVAAATDVGTVRQRNEDHAVVGTVRLGGERDRHDEQVDVAAIVAVMDGMGGHPAGDVASGLVAEALIAVDASTVTDATAVSALVAELDRGLVGHMTAHPETRAMGTTLVGANVLAVDRALAFAIGDSLALWWADDELRLLFPPDRGRWGGITQVLGGGMGDELDSSLAPHVAELSGPGRLVLSSDGLTDMVEATDMRPAMAHDDVGTCADELVALALAAGGVDNVTVAVLDLAAPTT